MLKTILDKAIGYDKPTELCENLCDSCLKAEGYNLAKAEMRAKIPQVVEEVMCFLKGKQELFNSIPHDEYGYKKIKTTDLNITGIIKSLTENK